MLKSQFTVEQDSQDYGQGWTAGWLSSPPRGSCRSQKVSVGQPELYIMVYNLTLFVSDTVRHLCVLVDY